MTDQIGLCGITDGQPGPAWIALRQDGRCDLGFEVQESRTVFQASMGTLMDIGLVSGAILSDGEDACSVSTRGHKLAFRITKESGEPREWLIPNATFTSAVAKLMATKVELELLAKPDRA